MIDRSMVMTFRWSWERTEFIFEIPGVYARTTLMHAKDLLFCDHAPSYYGTLVTVNDNASRPSLTLPAWQAVSFFASAGGQQQRLPGLVEWHGPVAPAMMRSVALFYLEALERGWFAPDFAAWQEGRWKWMLDVPDSLPEDFPAPLHETRHLLQVSEHRTFFHAWFTAAVADLHNDPAVYPHWQDVSDTYRIATALSIGKQKRQLPELHPIEEQEWLTSIGWQRDAIAVQFGLRLLEPTTEANDWHLVPVVRPLLTDDWLEFPIFQTAIVDVYNDQQKAELNNRYVKMYSSWLRIAPGLAPYVEADETFALDDEAAWLFLTEWANELISHGVSVWFPDWWQTNKRRSPVLKGTMRSGLNEATTPLLGLQQMLQFDWRIALDDEVELDEAQFLQLVEAKKRWIRMGGKWFVLTDRWMAQIREQLEQHRRNGGLTLAETLRMMLQTDDAAGDNENNSDKDNEIGSDEDSDEVNHAFVKRTVRMSDAFAEHFKQLLNPESLNKLAQPHRFVGQLYEYQQFGFSWLLLMRKLGIGACLADDMGLGKTIQLIAYLLETRQSRADAAPALLVCPHSVLGNWQRELRAFAPALNIYVHHGIDRKKSNEFLAAVHRKDLVLTTYSLLDPDMPELQSVEWDLVCIDEAQNIKNPNTKQSKAVRVLTAAHRIAMTGTPIENNLTELWSIYDFLNPGYLGSLAQFKQQYVRRIERQKNQDSRRRLRLIIRPFLLRREKKNPQIRLSLPEKHEVKVYVQMTAEQTALYESVRTDLLDKVQKGESLQMGAVLQAIMKYKQICDHPLLLDQATRTAQVESGERSNKLLRLLEMVEEIHERGERSIIFTQYVEMGKIIVRALKKRLPARDICLFDGSANLKQREQMIADFQDIHSGHPVLVLTIRAGGVGINLTAANHVFHYDRWWNPAVENQAADRVYRIGQSKDVTIYKLITSGTIEEKIDGLLSSKAELADYMLNNEDDQLLKKLTLKEWERLIL